MDLNTSSSESQSVFVGYISEEEYARQRVVSVRTCQRDRAMRQAPPHVIIGRTVYYRVEAVRSWLEAQERRFEANHINSKAVPQRRP